MTLPIRTLNILLDNQEDAALVRSADDDTPVTDLRLVVNDTGPIRLRFLRRREDDQSQMDFVDLGTDYNIELAGRKVDGLAAEDDLLFLAQTFTRTIEGTDPTPADVFYEGRLSLNTAEAQAAVGSESSIEIFTEVELTDPGDPSDVSTPMRARSTLVRDVRQGPENDPEPVSDFTRANILVRTGTAAELDGIVLGDDGDAELAVETTADGTPVRLRSGVGSKMGGYAIGGKKHLRSAGTDVTGISDVTIADTVVPVVAGKSIVEYEIRFKITTGSWDASGIRLDASLASGNTTELAVLWQILAPNFSQLKYTTAATATSTSFIPSQMEPGTDLYLKVRVAVDGADAGTEVRIRASEETEDATKVEAFVLSISQISGV